MTPFILAETNWKSVKEQKYELAVLPWGATEAHNYHLPYGTDSIQTERIATESARIAWDKGALPIVLPTIPFGVNTGQTDIKLIMNLNPSTQYAILDNIINNLYNHSLYKLLIVNGHGGNDFKQIMRELGLKYPKMLLCSCNWYQSVDKKMFFENDGDHADEMETSIMQYLTPNLVLPLKEAGKGNGKSFKINALNEKWAWTERKWTKVTSDTGIGNPQKANALKGEKCFKEIIVKVSELMYELCKANVDDMYE